jgi:hypothetical protein
MGSINYGRVVLGGLVAGLVINLSEFVLNGLILMDDYAAAMESYNLTEASWAMGGYIGSAFILGLVVAWLYAAIRPRFGAGAKTGVTAGVVLWLGGYIVPSIWFLAMGMNYGTGLTVLSLVWGLAELAVAGMVAGWLYREGGAADAGAAAASPGPA